MQWKKNWRRGLTISRGKPGFRGKITGRIDGRNQEVQRQRREENDKKILDDISIGQLPGTMRDEKLVASTCKCKNFSVERVKDVVTSPLLATMVK